MRRGIDANVLYAATASDGSVRRLVLEGDPDLYAPEWLWDELDPHRRVLLSKSGASAASYDLLLGLFGYAIRDVPSTVTARLLDAALKRTGLTHGADAPYVATAIAIDAARWTHDKALARKATVPIVATADLLARAREQSAGALVKRENARRSSLLCALSGVVASCARGANSRPAGGRQALSAIRRPRPAASGCPCGRRRASHSARRGARR
ncbi:MAG: PIN domain-containing protein [Thermoplasmatota archaeon]